MASLVSAPDARRCFFLNLYNALTVHAVVAATEERGGAPLASVAEVGGFWRRFAYNVGGEVFTLDDIEHGVLRGAGGCRNRFAQSKPHTWRRFLMMPLRRLKRRWWSLLSRRRPPAPVGALRAVLLPTRRPARPPGGTHRPAGALRAQLRRPEARLQLIAFALSCTRRRLGLVGACAYVVSRVVAALSVGLPQLPADPGVHASQP